MMFGVLLLPGAPTLLVATNLNGPAELVRSIMSASAGMGLRGMLILLPRRQPRTSSRAHRVRVM